MVRISAKFNLLAAAFLAVGYLTPAPVKAASASPIGLAKKHFFNVARSKELDHEVIV